MIWYDIFVNCSWVVTRWQYTFTHKQYIEQYKINNTYNNTTILEECGPCPVLASFTLAFALQQRKKHGKTSVRVGYFDYVMPALDISTEWTALLVTGLTGNVA